MFMPSFDVFSRPVQWGVHGILERVWRLEYVLEHAWLAEGGRGLQ